MIRAKIKQHANITIVQKFLGFTSSFWKFVNNSVAKISYTRWSTQWEESFKCLKEKLAYDPDMKRISLHTGL